MKKVGTEDVDLTTRYIAIEIEGKLAELRVWLQRNAEAAPEQIEIVGRKKK